MGQCLRILSTQKTRRYVRSKQTNRCSQQISVKEITGCHSGRQVWQTKQSTDSCQNVPMDQSDLRTGDSGKDSGFTSMEPSPALRGIDVPVADIMVPSPLEGVQYRNTSGNTIDYTSTVYDNTASTCDERTIVEVYNICKPLNYRAYTNTKGLMQASADLKNACPLISSEVVTNSCDYNGRTMYSREGDIKIIIPKGAIKKEDLVLFAVASSLYSPFSLPLQYSVADLVSPYYWIGITGSYYFQKPIEIELEHFAAVTTHDNSHFCLLVCEDGKYVMQPAVNYVLNFKVQNNVPLCVFQTNHFCSYCLFHCCQDQVKKNKIGAYCLKPKNFQNLNFFTVEIWFSFPISHCLKRNRELYTQRNLILDTSGSYIFEASCNESIGSYFTLQYDNSINDWQMDHSLTRKILTKKVNFYNDYTNKEDLQASEEDSLFPPRFIVNVIKKTGCTNDLNTNIIIALYNNESEPVAESIQFKVFIPISVKRNSGQPPLPSVDQHSCKKNQPTLKELVKYSTKISTHWKEIALHLEISEHKISAINIDHSNNVADKCYEMFNTWLQISVSPCWCCFIQALCAHDVGLCKVAEEAKTHLKFDSGIKSPNANESKLKDNLHRLPRILKDVPEHNFNYIIMCLLSNENAVDVIKDIEVNGKNKEDNVKKLCEAFLKEQDPSWNKVHKALEDIKCDGLAYLVKACFL